MPAGHIPILVAIETDSTRYHGEHAGRPRLLGKRDSEQVLAHLSADLASLFADIGKCALAMPGALYDQTQLLRPGYPVYEALGSMLAESLGDGDIGPSLLSIGESGGRMPVAELQPGPDIPPGLLQILPVLVSGDPERTEPLSELMEHQFLESGQVSAHSARGLEANFEIAVTHARFMTLTDLHAMLRLQLEHFGFLPLWKLIDAAINDVRESFNVTGRDGQHFHWQGGTVRCRFETFDHWSNHGSGRDSAGAGQVLAKKYADFTREYRQYLTTLQAHTIPVVQHLPGRRDEALEGSFLVEQSPLSPGAHAAQVTEHSSADLGTVAVTVAAQGRQMNYYPLSPTGLNDLHASIRAAGFGSGGVSFPGCINHDEHTRRLVPDRLPAGHA